MLQLLKKGSADVIKTDTTISKFSTAYSFPTVYESEELSNKIIEKVCCSFLYFGFYLKVIVMLYMVYLFALSVIKYRMVVFVAM